MGESKMKNSEKKNEKVQLSLAAKIMAGFLAALMLAGTVFGLLTMLL
jgi:hypothetical protein